MKSMNRKGNKKIAVMAAVIVGLMMFAFMPLASAEVTSFSVTPSTGLVGAVDSYNILVTTTGVNTLNITIPAGFIAVAPTTGGVLIAEVNFWNSTKKAYYGYATITSNDTNWTEQVKVCCKFPGGDEITTIQNVNYTAGETSTFESGYTSDNSSAIIKLPTEDAPGSIKISINCTEFQLDDVMIAIKQFVRNPLSPPNTYAFSADGEPELVSITEPNGRGIVFRNGVWFVDTNGNHIADVVFSYGTTEDVPLVWGDNGVAVFRNGMWYVDTTGNRVVDLVFYYGDAGDVPLVGDMNLDGIVDIAVFRKGMWYVNTSVATIVSYEPVGVDLDFAYGIGKDVPLVGDMDCKGPSDIAVFRNGTWYIDTTGSHVADRTIHYGDAGDVPLVGDFERDGTDDIAVFREGMWYVDTTCLGIEPTSEYAYGITGDKPLVGILE